MTQDLETTDMERIKGMFTAYEFLIEVILAQQWANISKDDEKRVREKLTDLVRFSAYVRKEHTEETDYLQVQSACIEVVERAFSKASERAEEIRRTVEGRTRQG